MKAELIIPDGYKRVTQGFVKKEDYVFDPANMTWDKLDYCCHIRDCFFVIRKVEAE
jgi:hypothetical protein